MDIFTEAQATIRPFLDATGYEPKTTFWTDFTIADRFGIDAVKDTYNRAFEEWKSNKVYVTELVLVLNWKIWQHAESNEPLARVYNELWEQTDQWCLENLKDDDKAYFLRTID